MIRLLGCLTICTVTTSCTWFGGEARDATPHERRVARWQDRRFGLFIHWGLYSELGGVWEGQRVERGYSEQIQAWAQIPHQEYARVATRFDPTGPRP